jgi:hypothetical protein
MSETTLWPWVGLLLLGAWHGINPGMGWLFAVALGLQGQGRVAVWRALPPLAAGHALAIAAAVLAAGLIGLVVPTAWLKWLVAVTLFAFGSWRLFRSRHPRYGGMQVGARDLTIWSFLMASAHGAGLMVLPFFLGIAAQAHAGRHVTHAHGMSPGSPSHAGHAIAMLAGVAGDQWAAIAATLLHTAGYLLVMALVDVFVYEWVGL